MRSARSLSSGKGLRPSRVPSIFVLHSFACLLARTPSLSFLLPVPPECFCRESLCLGKRWDYRKLRTVSARRSPSLAHDLRKVLHEEAASFLFPCANKGSQVPRKTLMIG